MPPTTARWTFIDDPVRVTETVTGAPAQIVTHPDRAQAAVLLRPRPAPGGNSALFLDGWSTWVEAQSPFSSAATLGLGCWFAPRSFSMGHDDDFVAIVDLLDASGGVALGYDPAGRIVALLRDDEATLRRVEGEATLTPFAWNHVALNRDETGVVRLYLDGVVRASEATAAGPLTFPARLTLGRSRGGGVVAGIVPTAVAAGLLGETRLADAPIDAAALAASDLPRPHLEPDRARYADDDSRPIYHVSAPQGWMNEPHGAIATRGVHHLFYQHNPSGPYWARIAWGHLVSHDLAHWDDRPPALETSSSPIAPGGIWSGSSVLDDDGEHLLVFTAGDYDRAPNQGVAVARPHVSTSHPGGWRADGSWLLEQPSTSPGVDAPLVTGEFRDPFAWRENGEWFMLVGSGFDGRGGAALLFSSADGSSWTQHEPLMIGDALSHPRTGVMWELPVLLPLGRGADGRRRHALFVAPWWPAASEHHLQYVWHWIGTWDAAARRFTPDTAEPRHFDGGGHLTGPSGTTLEDGRAVLWTIAQDERDTASQARAGWAHNAGLPLELGIHDDGALLVRPLPELRRLRERPLLELSAPTPVEAERALAGVRGRHLEIELGVRLGGGEVALELARTPDGHETTRLGYDHERGELWIDRSASSRATAHREARRGITAPASATSTLRVFLDGSMVEAYLDDRISLTSRAYPLGLDADRLALSLPRDASVVSLTVHPLHSAFAGA